MELINEVISFLKISPMFLEKLIENISIEELKKRRIKNRWSAYEHTCHVCIGEKNGFHKRFLQFQNEEYPSIMPVSGNDYPDDYYLTFDIFDCLKEFKELRKKTIDLAMGCSIEFWEKRANHPEYKIYTPKIMLNHLLLHDYAHFTK